MSGRLLVYILGRLMVLEAALMLPPLALALVDGSGDAPAFVYSMLLLLGCGWLAQRAKPARRDIRAKEALVSVSLAWLALSAFGALPFMFSSTAVYFWDAFFEAASGFTTTGATVLPSVAGLPRGIQFWSALMHWVGGMGVLVLTLAIMPNVGARGASLARAESPGHSFTRMAPRIRDTARVMYGIYIGMTALQFVLLLVTGLSAYDALIHALGTACTGGYSNRLRSVAEFNNPWAEMVIILFMFLFGANFSIYHRLLRGEGKKALRSEELRAYTLVGLLGTMLVAWQIWPRYGNAATALRYAGFQVTSILSTTGFATADYTLWPQFTHILLLIIMLIGASAGSTAGGLKMSRVILLTKTAAREVGLSLAPRKLRPVRFDGRVQSEATLRAVLGYFALYASVLFVGTLLATLDGHDFVTCFSAVASCLSNIGPGLGLVGPAGNFGIFSPGVKLLLSFLMLLGRLEFIPLMVLLHRELWGKGH